MQFAQLLQLRETGVQVPPAELIKASTLQGKNELIQSIQEYEQQQSQMAQQKQMVQMEVLKAQIEDLKAKAMANEGLGYERASRVAENKALAVERIATAQKQRDLGTLDRIRAVKELADIDLSQLERLINIVKSLEGDAQEQATTEAAIQTQPPQPAQPQQSEQIMPTQQSA